VGSFEKSRHEAPRQNLYFKSDEHKIGMSASIDKFDKMMNLSLQMDEQYKSDKEFMDRLFKANLDRIKHTNKIKEHLLRSSTFQKVSSFALEQSGNADPNDSGVNDFETEEEERGWFS
jgi:hypothetical protein